MCGIAGYIGSEAASPIEWRPRLQRAMDAMTLRGPDDHGTFFAPRVGLAHRRLSIIDLQGGRQPLVDKESGAVIVFNGEIYNYREIRQTLIAAGHAFLTQSDTEVLLRAYLEWGKDCLEKLLGMFAFAVYTPQDGELFLARDRLGIKPLFWSDQQGTVCFASSARALLDLLPQIPPLDVTALSHYLSTIRVNMGDQTLWHGVRLLAPGHWMRIRASGEKQMHCYWAPPTLTAAEKSRQTLDEAAQALGELMEDAVRLRLISDVPLGGFLSGGLDSTIIAALASRLSGQNYHAYNVGYTQPGYNEFPFVRQAADAYAMRCRQIELDPAEYPGLWQGLVRLNGLPMTTPNEVPIYLLSKHLRQDYTVALSGEGADEVFGGYTIAYFSGNDYDRAHREPQPESGWTEVDRALMRAYGQAHLPDLTRQHFLLNSWMSGADKRRWLHADVVQFLDQDRAMNAYYDGLFNAHPQMSTMDRIMHAHLRVNLEGLLLRVDSSSMAASVEVRVPFTDHRLVELAFSLPDAYRLDWRNPAAREAGRHLNVSEIVQQDLLESKRVLRRAYAGKVPDDIMNRSKMSFPVPVFDWMGDWMKPLTKEIISASPLRNSLFNPAVINAWLDDKRPISPVKLWPVLNLCLWQLTVSGSDTAV
jgi:asparagine synthase (glutamine-hydrolysing)